MVPGPSKAIRWGSMVAWILSSSLLDGQDWILYSEGEASYPGYYTQKVAFLPWWSSRMGPRTPVAHV